MSEFSVCKMCENNSDTQIIVCTLWYWLITHDDKYNFFSQKHLRLYVYNAIVLIIDLVLTKIAAVKLVESSPGSKSWRNMKKTFC